MAPSLLHILSKFQDGISNILEDTAFENDGTIKNEVRNSVDILRLCRVTSWNEICHWYVLIRQT